MKIRFAPVLVLLAGFVASLAVTSPAQADPLTGEFVGDELSVTVKVSGSGYAGEILRGKNMFPFTARAQGPGLAGAFRFNDAEYPFTAKVEGDRMQLETGGTTFVLQRKKTTPANPLANPEEPETPPVNPLGGEEEDPAPPEPPRPPEPPVPTPGGEKVTHSGGFTVTVPKGWKHEVTGERVDMTLPGGERPRCLAGIGLERLPSVQRIDDPEFVAYVKQTHGEQSPSRIVGEPQLLERGPRRILALALTERKPDAGNPVDCRQYLFLLRPGELVVMQAFGPPPELPKLEATFLSIVDSVTATERETPEPVDAVAPPPAGSIIGKWKDDQTLIEFRSDGTLVITVVEVEGMTLNGTWKVQGDRLTVDLDGETQTTQYKIEGDRLIIIEDGNVAAEMTRVR